MFYKDRYERMLIEDGWMRLSYRQRNDIKRVIIALVEYDRGLIHDDDLHAVVDPIEPIRVRCAICLHRRDYTHALELLEQMGFNMGC